MQIYPRVYGKHFKLSGGKSHIHVFNIHTYFLTIENAYFISSIKNHFYSKFIYWFCYQDKTLHEQSLAKKKKQTGTKYICRV